ncbi:MAG: tetratricopeptide repeat protein [Chloroflexi bacterium]|nr:tetratricopeptide repeat protein [Chloroflexota bacterium]
MRKGRRRANSWRILILVALIGGALYINRFIVPTVAPVGLPTAPPTRSPVSYAEEGDAFFATGKFKRAVEAYQLAISADPTNLKYYLALARIQIFGADYEKALATSERAILVNPDSASAHATKGRVLALMPDRAADAEAEVFKALQLDPGLAEAHAYYAEMLTDQLRWNEAAEEARKALAILPNSLEGRLALAYVYENTGNYDEAIAEYEKARSINPNVPAVYIQLGNNYRAKGDTTTAISLYQKAIALNPEDPAPYSLIAQTYGSAGEYGKGSQYAEQAVALDPSNPRLHGLLGRLYYRNNELAKSLPEFDLATRGGQTAGGVSVVGLEPAPGVVAEYYYTYGLALVKLQRCSEARPLFDLLLATITADQDEIAVFNAQEGINQCLQLQADQTAAGTPTPTPKP